MRSSDTEHMNVQEGLDPHKLWKSYMRVANFTKQTGLPSSILEIEGQNLRSRR